PPRFGVSQYADLHKPRAARKIARFMGFSCKASRSYASFASRLRRPPTGIGGSSYPGAHASSESVWSTSYSARSSFVRYGSHFSNVIIFACRMPRLAAALGLGLPGTSPGPGFHPSASPCGNLLRLVDAAPSHRPEPLRFEDLVEVLGLLGSDGTRVRPSPARNSCRSRAPFRVLHDLHASA